ncbi:MAG: pentapeptide repeat-containing protein [Hydrotalea sp.]|nr:pentapeptide repeat-containing protein [Hydrotalea sp.]
MTESEWLKLWERMTKRRNEQEIINRPLKYLEKAFSEMVRALITSAASWGAWQRKNPVFPGFGYLGENINLQFLDFFYDVDLEKATFINSIDFSNSNFEGYVNFSKAEFKKGANFGDAIFNQSARFEEAIFSQESNFTFACFKEESDFNKARFPAEANFTRAHFSSNANFEEVEAKHLIFLGASFWGDVRFQNSNISVRFEKANFDINKDIFFNNCILTGINFAGCDVGYISCMDAIFKGEASFEKTNFEKESIFSNSQFEKKASFQGATFKGNQINFSRVIFNDSADFSDSSFYKNAKDNITSFKQVQFSFLNFSNAVFGTKVLFSDVTCNENVNFFKTTFEDNVDFVGIKFKKVADFSEAVFAGNDVKFNKMILTSDANLILAKVEFEETIPDFTNANRVSDIRFSKLNIPSLKELKRGNKLDEKYDDIFQKLKEIAITNHQYEYELKFNAIQLEIRLMRLREANKFYNIIDIAVIKLYSFLSDYGQSISRPFWSFLGLIILSNIYVYIYKINLETFLQTLFLSVKAIAPIPLLIADVDSFPHLFAKIFSAILLFLLGLGIRNKLKIK